MRIPKIGETEYLDGPPSDEWLFKLEAQRKIFELTILFVGAAHYSKLACDPAIQKSNLSSKLNVLNLDYFTAIVNRLLLDIAIMLRCPIEHRDRFSSATMRRINVNVGTIESNSLVKKLDMKECLNKIIHAKSVTFEREVLPHYIYEYKTVFFLKGMRLDKEWICTVNAIDFCKAAAVFEDELI